MLWLQAEYTQQNAVQNLDQRLSAWLAQHSALTKTNRAASTYANDVERLAYCLGHFPVAVRTVARELATPSRLPFPHGASILGRALDVVSLGCGPGSDLVGALFALGAVPKNLGLHCADIEPGWGPWVTRAVASIVSADPLLQQVSPAAVFAQLDLNKPDDVRAYLRALRPRGATLYLLNRVLGTVGNPAGLMDAIIEAASDDCSHLLVIVPPRDGALLEEFHTRLERSARRGIGKLVDYGGFVHHEWTFPPAIWNALAHKPEVAAEYHALHYVLDAAAAIRFPR